MKREMAEKLRITEGEWGLKYNQIELGWAVFSLNNGGNIGFVHNRWRDEDINHDNAKAICRAVNNTYAKGLNPQSFDRLIKAAVDVLNFTKCHTPIGFLEVEAIKELETAILGAKM